MSETKRLGKVVRHEFDTIAGKAVEVQARQIDDEFIAEWSFDGLNWNKLIRRYTDAGNAIFMARQAAIISHIHQNLRKERGES